MRRGVAPAPRDGPGRHASSGSVDRGGPLLEPRRDLTDGPPVLISTATCTPPRLQHPRLPRRRRTAGRPYADPMGQVPAATKAMRVLKFLASQPDPVPLDRIMRACGLPRSTAYHLMAAMVEEGFVTH